MKEGEYPQVKDPVLPDPIEIDSDDEDDEEAVVEYEHMCELREKEITKRKKQAVYNYYKELGNGVELVLDITFTSEVTMHDLWHHTHNGGLGTVSDLPEGTTMRIR